MEPNVYDKVKQVDLKKTMESSYIDYAMSVIVSRALPDVRDGLKPVQRRILYSLQTLGVTPDAKTKKCATIVGETMGKYHPHGDSSIYGALVNMGQPWNYRKVLIDKQGNFGSEDGDSPAAMRYTEAKMSKMAALMLDGINKDEVDFVPNFSNEYEEPVVLPARFPNLLVNGATGIAVGMATNIPPHNLVEVINAVVKIIDDKIENKKTEVSDLMQIIKGPDFPTGAKILGKKGIKNYLQTGKGKINIRAICEIETNDKGKQKIIVKQLPYLVHRSELIKKIADLVKEKKIDGITGIIDVYGKKTSEKIHIELRKDANANVILNQLYKRTELQSSFSVQMLCIVDGTPKTLNVLELLEEFLKHQFNVVTRRTKFDLNKCEERAHILEGLLKALDIIDDIIKTIKESEDAEDATNNLITKFDFTQKQAQSIVDMRLRALTNLEYLKLKNEYEDLIEKIKYYKKILADDKLMLGVIKEEILEIINKQHDERNTIIENEEINDFNDEELIIEDNIIVTMTHFGYIKRMNKNTFKSQSRGGKGIKAMSTINDDFVEELFMTTMHSNIMFVSNIGKIYMLKGFQIPEANRISKGTAIVNLLKLKGNEYIVAGIDCKNLDDDNYLIFATKNGIIKKTSLSEFNNINTNGKKAIIIKEKDELISVKIINNKDEIFLITKKGRCLHIKQDKIRNMGRNTAGIRAIKIKNDDELKQMLISSEGEQILLVSEKGKGKRVDKNEFDIKNKGGVGTTCYKPNAKTGDIAGAILVNGDEDIMIINETGNIIRLKSKNIRMCSRVSQGVSIMKNNENIKISSITKVINEKEQENK